MYVIPHRPPPSRPSPRPDPPDPSAGSTPIPRPLHPRLRNPVVSGGCFIIFQRGVQCLLVSGRWAGSALTER
eukprot:833277-Pyramimonas_sp.AAC.1